MFESLNLWAVLTVTIVSMIIGWLWYSNMLFGKLWTKALGWDSKTLAKMRKEGGMWRSMFFQLVSTFVATLALALLISALNITSWAIGLAFGLFIWLAFFVTNNGAVIFERRSRKAWVIWLGYEFIVLAMSGAVLVIWTK